VVIKPAEVRSLGIFFYQMKYILAAFVGINLAIWLVVLVMYQQ